MKSTINFIWFLIPLISITLSSSSVAAPRLSTTAVTDSSISFSWTFDMRDDGYHSVYDVSTNKVVCSDFVDETSCTVEGLRSNYSSRYVVRKAGLINRYSNTLPVTTTRVYATHKPHLLWHNSTTGAIRFMQTDGMTPETNIDIVSTSNTNLLPKGIGDFTGDGKPDILFHNQNSGNLRIWEMDRSTKIYNHTVLSSSNTNLKIAGVGDFNDDGDIDIATFNTATGSLRLWLMRGIERIDNVLVLSGANVNLVPRGVGDMDNDGIPDIVLRNNNSGAVRVWTMNNDFTRKGNEYVTGSSNTNLQLRGILDINGDGNSDILNYNTNTGRLRAWLMDGSMGILENAEVVQDSDLDWNPRGGYYNQISLSGEVSVEDPSIINIAFHVTDKDGHGVTDLIESDFEIYEDGDPISTRESFYRIVKDTPGTSEQYVLFMLDVSTSISFQELATMKQALKDYIYDTDTNSGNIPKNTKIAIKTFSYEIQDISDYTDNVNALLLAIDTIETGEPTTNLFGAFNIGLEFTKRNIFSYNTFQIGSLVLMTDGKDQAASERPCMSCKDNKNIFVIHIDSPEADRSVSESLASQNKLYDLKDFSDLTQAFDNFNTYMEGLSNSFYNLRYASPKRDGTHTVRVNIDQGVITSSFDARSFSSVRPELHVLGLDLNASLVKYSQHVLNADILWTLPANIDYETFIWNSSDSSILHIDQVNHDEANITFLGDGDVNLTLEASAHGLTKQIKLSNKPPPTLIGSLEKTAIDRGIYTIAIAENYAYLSTSYAGLKIIDISNPSFPTFVSEYTTLSYLRNIDFAGNYAYVLQGTAPELLILDISTPTSPVLVGSYGSPIDYGTDMSVVGDYAYIADRTGLKIIDISTPTSPTLVGSYTTVGDAFGISVVGNYAYVADRAGGIKILDISNPASPTLIGSYATVGEARSISVVGNYAYINELTSLLILDISNPTSPVFVSSVSFHNFLLDMSVVGNYVYVVNRDEGVKILDVSDPSSPYVFDTYEQFTNASVIAVSNEYMYLGGEDYGELDRFQIVTSMDSPELDYFYIKDSN